MIVVAVVYNVLVMAEGYKRSTIGVADAQVTGQLAQFVVGRELANGGAAMMTGVDELSRCADWRLKALPVAITAGANANTSDELLVFYSSSPRVVHPVWFSELSEPHARAVLRRQPERIQDRRLGDRHGPRARLRAGESHGHQAERRQRVSARRASAARSRSATRPRSRPAGRSTRTGGCSTWARSCCGADTRWIPPKAQLNTQNVNWLDPGFPLPVVPLAQNVVLMKAQYGVDPPPSPTTSSTAGRRPTTPTRAATASTIRARPTWPSPAPSPAAPS